MGFLDALFGRSRPPRADLDVLFAVPQAATTLRAEGCLFTGHGAVPRPEGGADDGSSSRRGR